jgi:hypothetical protein
MSNSLAIATVTAALRNLIQKGLDKDRFPVSGAKVSTQPPDEVKTGADLINLFLYQTAINGAWRNMDIPRRVKPGETGQPPLALNLYYLLTAYGKDNDSTEPVSHRLLGRAMRVLHDHPLLSSDEIKTALTNNDLSDQIEHVRITPQPISVDEMSKLWATFQGAKYRISTAYQVAVVLIDSQQASTTPLPVLTRGEEDRGVDAQANLVSPFPTLTGIALPEAKKKQPNPVLGDTLILRGYQLDGDSLTVRFSNPRLTAPIEINLPGIVTSEETDVSVPLPDTPASHADWVAGYYTVSIVVTRNSDPVNKTRTTNELAFALAPRILTPPGPVPKTQPAAGGDFTLTLKCSPQVRPQQTVSLLFGAYEFAGDTRLVNTDTLTFLITPVTRRLIKGDYFLRLRVDGSDSLLVKYDQTPLTFDNDQKVTIT